MAKKVIVLDDDFILSQASLVDVEAASSAASFILKTASAALPNAQSLGLLTTGLLKNTVVDGVGTLSQAIADTDYIMTLNNFTTTNLSEGTNLYYTDERVDDRVYALVQGGTGISWVYSDLNGTLTPTVTLSPFTTTNLAEGTNLYYTDARVRAAVSSTATGLTYTGATGVFSLTTDYVIPTVSEMAAKAPLVSPSFTTPNIGVATGTSLALNGATLGTNKFAIDGTSYLNGDVTITGNLTLFTPGNQFIVNAQTVSVADNLIVLNKDEVGVGVTNVIGGIEIERGSLTNFQFVFDEVTDLFRVGAVGSLQAVATREDTPVDTAIAFWNASTYRWETSSALKWNGSTLVNPALGVATATTLAIGGATIGTNALAVTGTSYFNGDISTRSSGVINFGDVFNTGSFIFKNAGTSLLTISPSLGIVANNYGFSADAGSVNALSFAIGSSSASGLGMYGAGANILGFATNSIERLRISSTGASFSVAVGIGTTTPSGLLDLVKAENNVDAVLNITNYSITATDYSIINLRKSNSATAGTKSTTSSGDILGTISGYGVELNPNFNEGTRIEFAQSGAANTTIPAEIRFFTCPGAGTAIQQRMVIDKSGNVGVGTTSPTLGKLEIFGAKTAPDAYNYGMLNIHDTTAFAAGVGGAISFSGYQDATPTQVMGGSINLYKINGTSGDNSFGLKFYTKNNGTDPTAKLTIDNVGNATFSGTLSSVSLATSAAIPLLLTNGQLVNISLTAQTVGATTLTIPDFAGVVDEFTFKTKAQTLSNKTFVAPALGNATATTLAIGGATIGTNALAVNGNIDVYGANTFGYFGGVLTGRTVEIGVSGGYAVIQGRGARGGALDAQDLSLQNVGGALLVGYTADPTSGNKFAVNGNSYFNGTVTTINSIDNTLTITTTGTANAAILKTVSGNGTTSGRYSYSLYLASETSPQDWRVGMYGDKNYKVYNSTLNRTPFVINSDAIDQSIVLSSTSATFSGSVLLPNGTAAAPALSFSGATNSGIFRNASVSGYLNFATEGTWRVTIGDMGLKLAQDKSLAWSSAESTTADLFLTRDAANTLALRNSTNAQTFNIYNTYTDASNYERFEIKWNSNSIELGVNKGVSSGSLRGVIVAGATIKLNEAGVGTRWQMIAGGHLQPENNNVYDLGGTSNKVRTGYFGTSVQTASLNLTGIQDISSSAYTVVSTDSLVKCNALSNAITITLPSAITNAGKLLIIKKTDASTNIVTINTTSSQTINGELNQYLYDQHDALLIISDGANWDLS